MFDLKYYNEIIAIGKGLEEIMNDNLNDGQTDFIKERASMSKYAFDAKYAAMRERKYLFIIDADNKHDGYMEWYESYDNKWCRNNEKFKRKNTDEFGLKGLNKVMNIAPSLVKM